MKIGIISFAHMHAVSYATYITQHPDAELTCIWDADEGRGREMAEKFSCKYFSSLDEFLHTDIEAVVVCSENANHKEHVVKAAEAKKHVLCEKPIATEVEDAKAMIQACEEAGVFLEIAYPVRFAPGFQQAKKLIEQGAIGEVVAITGTNHGKMPGGWFIEKELSGGGAATDHIVHIMDIIRWVMKEEVHSIYAEMDTRFYDIDVEDCGLVTIELESGIIVSIDHSWSRPQTFPTWGDAIIKFVGTKGSLEVDAFKQFALYYNDEDKTISQLSFAEDMDDGLVNDFIACVKEGIAPSISGTDGLRTLEVVKAAYQSHEEGKTVLVKR
ncbi:Gfo/Idh/MocA family oxidoreductase [Lederbergia sp. NSJ-179]|uniref:Gfo/Idh/MocA family protein n=1 Tax=Lederbergia sp. NSJ-179 TaxID=2931402 RepID=UPI001FD62E18|nr:Gfo/Idh/MocA family oxidoreductase [Lederbergia sp. NSJ-179]MCJ7840767.1 Gfo/Idh/MocA family oxidoreductase [Lederbergia sp. NSJ-179]